MQIISVEIPNYVFEHRFEFDVKKIVKELILRECWRVFSQVLLIATFCDTLQTKILQKVAAETTPCSSFAIVRGGMVWCWLFDTWGASSRLLIFWLIDYLDLFSSHIFRESDWNELSARSWNGQFIPSLEMADWRHYLVLFAWVPGKRKKEHHNRCAFKTTGCAQSEHNKRHMSNCLDLLHAMMHCTDFRNIRSDLKP